MGLIGILDNKSLTNHNNQCLDHLEVAAEDLDTVIKDLNETLVYQNASDCIPESVSLKNIVQNVLGKMEKTMLQENVKVYNLLSSHLKVQAIKPYLEISLEHLISNAIKFRSEERLVKITFSSRQEEGQIILSVADNGIGIDLEKYRDKIFGLYQRFHLHQEGKGIGLYSVKTQIEMMGGHVKVSSTVGEGTVFDLYLNTGVSNTYETIAHSENSTLNK